MIRGQKMACRTGVLFLTFLIGSLALPVKDGEDMSIFFDHTDSSARIVGGTEAGSVPHMAVITTGVYIRSLVCGGSVITDRHVLTAAHCIVAIRIGGSLTSSAAVTVGTNRWSTGGNQYSLAGNIVHADYSSSTIKNDIGLLLTRDPIVFNDAVQPIKLSYDVVPGGVPTVVNGWGRIVAGGSISPVLLELEATSLDGDTCISEMARVAASLNTRAPPVDPNLEICTFRALNFGTCNGDSGSALLSRDNMEQVGIVSWGMPCARGAPDIFVRISTYSNWIESNIAL